MTVEIADLSIGDVVATPAGGEWVVVDVFREPRFGMLVSATIEAPVSATIEAPICTRAVVDASPHEIEWVGPGPEGTNRWRWHPPEVSR